MTKLFSSYSTLTALFLMGACSSAERLLPLPPLNTELSLNSPHKTVELKDIELPNYAYQDAVVFMQKDGLITSIPDLLWADQPTRITTLKVAQHLDRILKDTTIASEPWPFYTEINRVVTVQIEDIIANDDGRFTLTGRYSIGSEDRETPITKHNVTITTAWRTDDYASLAKAQAEALLQLSEHIAQALSR